MKKARYDIFFHLKPEQNLKQFIRQIFVDGLILLLPVITDGCRHLFKRYGDPDAKELLALLLGDQLRNVFAASLPVLGRLDRYLFPKFDLILF